MSRRVERSTAARRAAAIVMVGALIAVIAAASGQFLGWFDSTRQVTLEAPRAGLVMNTDAKVKLRGVEVGRVGSITSRGDQAILTLDIDSDQLADIPGNVIADIKSNTIFGAKAVNLQIPDDGPVGHLQAGQIIAADRVVVELNTVYQQLVHVLAETQPDKLSAIIGAVDTALSGQGGRVGVALEQLTDIVGETNEHTAELNRMFTEAATVTGVYADAMPNLMRSVDNFTVLGNTLVDNAANLDALLIAATGMADTVDGVLASSKTDLINGLTDLSPVASLLGYQAPGLACFINSVAVGSKKAAPVFGGKYGLMLFAGLLPGSEPYRYPESLPINGADGPPTCEGALSDPSTTEHADFYVTNNAPQPYQPRTTPKANRQDVFRLLFGAPERG